jgi:hypothetical protein
MRRLLLATIVLLGIVLTPYASSFQPFNTRVVSKTKFLNLTENLPKTTIFTPSATDVYRVTLYVTVNGADGPNNGATVYWTDEFGARNAFTSLGWFNGPFTSTSSTAVWAKSGTPISIQVMTDSPGTVYDVYAVVERL